LRTVRTIIDQQDSTDQTTIKRLEQIDLDRPRERIWHAKRRCANRCPRPIGAHEKTSVELRKEAMNKAALRKWQRSAAEVERVRGPL
jgi:hypothetical protein